MSVYFLLLSREVSLSNYFSREVQGRYCFFCREGTHGDLTILFCLVRWTFWTTKLLASNSTKRPRFFSHDASHASFCTAMTQNNNSQPQPSIAFVAPRYSRLRQSPHEAMMFAQGLSFNGMLSDCKNNANPVSPRYFVLFATGKGF